MKKERLQQTAEIQRIIRTYYEKLYGNKIDSMEEMYRFFKKVQSSKTEPGRNRFWIITGTELQELK